MSNTLKAEHQADPLRRRSATPVMHPSAKALRRHRHHIRRRRRRFLLFGLVSATVVVAIAVVFIVYSRLDSVDSMWTAP